MEQKAKTQQPEKDKRSSDLPSGKVAPKGELGKPVAIAQKKDQGNWTSTAEKKDTGSRVKSKAKKSGSSSTTQPKASGSGDKKDSASKK